MRVAENSKNRPLLWSKKKNFATRILFSLNQQHDRLDKLFRASVKTVFEFKIPLGEEKIFSGCRLLYLLGFDHEADFCLFCVNRDYLIV